MQKVNDNITTSSLGVLVDLSNRSLATGRCAIFLHSSSGNEFSITCAAPDNPPITIDFDPDAPDDDEESESLAPLKQLLADGEVVKVVADFKSLYKAWAPAGFVEFNNIFELELAAYLLDPARENYSLGALLKDYPVESTAKLSETGVMLALHPVLEVLLEQNGLLKLYNEVELPIARILAEMELVGMHVDRAELESLQVEVSRDIQALQERIFLMAEKEFNINSDAQLAAVIYDRLGLGMPGDPKCRATDKETLDILSRQHPLPSAAILWRGHFKRLTQFIDPLLRKVSPKTGRIHATFNQKKVVSGRISTSEPSLQNIPRRSVEGARIRQCFTVPEGYVLLAADYNQIEPRLLAHLSGDPDMIRAFKSGLDLHSLTASQIFDVPITEVTPLMRDRAKTVFLSILYGKTPYRLALELNVTLGKARRYIDSVFDRYPKVREYVDRTVHDAEQKGYVTTILGRRRYLPGFQSKKKADHKKAAREAVNTSIQGSAADLIKLAMIKIDAGLNSGSTPAHLVLQVHDEVMLEVHDSVVGEVEQLVKTNMISVAELSVPLEVEIVISDKWGS